MWLANRPLQLDHHRIALLAIVALGVVLRIFGLWWDDGLYLHPDERFIAIVSSGRVDLPPPGNFDAIFDPAHSPLNPRRDGPDGEPLSFAYGTLPVYVQSAVSWAINLVSDTDFQSYQHLYRVGRILNVVLDTLTLLFVYLIGRRLFGRTSGLVAAALYALAVLPIQLSHFFTVDVWLTCFVTATLYFALRFLDAPTMGHAAAMAVTTGCAFATKASVPSLIVPLFVVAAWTVWKSPHRMRVIGYLAAATVIALAVFTLFEPYAIVRREPFIQDIRTQARIVRGEFDVPFTRQFVGLTRGTYDLRNMFLYSLGPGLLLSALAGVAFTARRAWQERSVALVVPLVWFVAYVPTLMITEARFLRYALPLVPVFAIFAAGLLVWLARHRQNLAWRVPLAAVLIVSAIWAFGFVSIYDREHPRIAASWWMSENIPTGSVVTAESWDDALPLPVQGMPQIGIDHLDFDLYSDRPPEDTAVYIAETLQAADYVILSSDRVKDSVDNLPWRYAVQNEYYRRLMAGQLGYRLVYEAELRPELFGVTYNDSQADESFTVYDHPHVRIFEKVEPLTTEEVRARLLWGIEQPWHPQRYPPEKQLTFGEPVETIATTDDAGWNTLAIDNSLVSIISWLLVIEAISLALLPLAALVFARMRDRGAFSSRLLGLIVLGWIGWLAASIGFWGSRALNIALTLVAVAALAWGLRWLMMQRGRTVELPTLRVYLTGSAVWGGSFAFFLLLRAIYPDFWQTWFGGEKPFELAYLRAVAGSAAYPPYDPWYADGFINYYYYGWHLVATAIKLSGVGVALGFQLASATFAALLCLQLTALGGWLARGFRASGARQIALTGALVVGATVFVGNLDALRQLIEQGGISTTEFDFWRSRSVIQYTINEFPYFTELWADLHPHVINLPILVLLLTLLAGSFLSAPPSERWPFTPMACLTLALVLGTIMVTNAWDAPLMIGLTVIALGYAGFLRSMRVGVAGLAIGGLVVAGAYLAFLPFFRQFYSVVEGVNRASNGSRLSEFLTVWGIYLAVIAIAIIVAAARRYRRTGATSDGIAFALLGAGSAVFGHFLVLLLNRDWPSPSALVSTAIAIAVTAGAATATRPGRLPAALLGIVAAFVATAGVLAGYRPAATVILAFAGAAMMFALEARRVPVRAIPWAMIAAGAVTIAGTELIYVADDLQNSDWERMNTVFKFYLQAWLLLAIGAAVVLAGLWKTSGLSFGPGNPETVGIIVERFSTTTVQSRPGLSANRWVARSGAIVGTAILCLGLIYPIVGTPVRLDWDMPSSPTGLTLDGYAWMDGGEIRSGIDEPVTFSGDLAAIEWLNENVDGTPVLLEASIGPYRGNGGRISSATGIPAVLGWDRHQRQQRYEPGISQRMADVRAIYNETDPVVKLEMLRRYNVRYIVVGDVERYWNFPEPPDYYATSEGLAAFDALVGTALTIAFQSGATTVYELADFPTIPPAPDARDDL